MVGIIPNSPKITQVRVSALITHSQKQGMFKNDKDFIFLVRSTEWDNQWIFPNGTINYGESLDTGLRRVIKEQTNIILREIEFLTLLQHIPSEDSSNKNHLFISAFYAHAPSAQNIILSEPYTAYQWFSVEEATDSMLIEDNSKELLNFYNTQMASLSFFKNNSAP